MVDRTIQWLANIWLAAIILITVLDFVGIFFRAPSALSGLSGMLAEAFNYKLYITISLFSWPPLLLLWWKERRENARTQ